MSDKEDCAVQIINEQLLQIIQAPTVGPLVLVLLHITQHAEELGSHSKRNLLVIYYQTSP